MASAAGSRVTAAATSTPLGSAANKLNQPKKPDTALLRPGLTTTVTGMRQAIHALETGTGEVRNYLLNEVNLIYECKVCHNMFRSLANLVAHKRSFCKSEYRQVSHIYNDHDSPKSAEPETVIVEAEPVSASLPPSTWDVENYAPSLELLKDAGILQDIVSRPVVNRLKPAKKPGIDGVVAGLKARAGVSDVGFYENRYRGIDEIKTASAGTLALEPINETNNGLFQTFRVKGGTGVTTGQNYRVVQEAQNPIVVAVGPNGRELPTGRPDGMEEDMEQGAEQGPASPGSSEGSKENRQEEDEEEQVKIKFPCPECKKSFTAVKTVFKHMVKFHDMDMQEAKTHRKEIKAGMIKIKMNEPGPGKEQTNANHTPGSVLGKTKKEISMSLAIALGLVDENGGSLVKTGEEKEKVEKRRGRPPKNRDDDDEISFNLDRISPEQMRELESQGRDELQKNSSSSPARWDGGKYKCQAGQCPKSFKTPTFLLQHYCQHYRQNIQNDFAEAVRKMKCPQCGATFAAANRLMIHIGATHKLVLRYVPKQDSLKQQSKPNSIQNMINSLAANKLNKPKKLDNKTTDPLGDAKTDTEEDM